MWLWGPRATLTGEGRGLALLPVARARRNSSGNELPAAEAAGPPGKQDTSPNRGDRSGLGGAQPGGSTVAGEGRLFLGLLMF